MILALGQLWAIITHDDIEWEEEKMRNQGLVLIGIVIISFGLMILIGNLFDVDVGLWCWPTGLILLGIWLFARPWLVGPDTVLQARVLGPIRRDGSWQVADEEIWLFVGDVRLDTTQAEVPEGETPIRVFAFVGDVRLRVPEGVGVSVSSTAFITDARLFGQKRDGVLAPVRLTSDSYETAKRKLHLEMTCFIASIRAVKA
jgi:hypothetical protein